MSRGLRRAVASVWDREARGSSGESVSVTVPVAAAGDAVQGAGGGDSRYDGNADSDAGDADGVGDAGDGNVGGESGDGEVGGTRGSSARSGDVIAATDSPQNPHSSKRLESGIQNDARLRRGCGC